MSQEDKIRIAAILMLIALLLCSCASTKVVTQYQDRYITKTELRVDSVWCDRWHTEYMRGDTVFVHDSVYLDRWHYETTTDTINIRDSIPYPVEVVKEVRVRNGYDKFTARGFWLMLVAILSALVIWLLKKTKYGRLVYKTISCLVRL